MLKVLTNLGIYTQTEGYRWPILYWLLNGESEDGITQKIMDLIRSGSQIPPETLQSMEAVIGDVWEKVRASITSGEDDIHERSNEISMATWRNIIQQVEHILNSCRFYCSQ